MKQNDSALIRVTLAAACRRRLTAVLLAAASLLGVFLGLLLQWFVDRQEAAIETMVRETEVACVVMDARGTTTDHIHVFSDVVAMVTGGRHERDCYLDAYVTGVRAKAVEELAWPNAVQLNKLYSLDSDPRLSAVEGAVVQLDSGWSEDVFQSSQRVCVVSEGALELVTQDEDGRPVVQVTRLDGAEVTLQVIGQAMGVADKCLYCPFFICMEDGQSEAFPIDSCSFVIRDNRRLQETKEALYQYFVEPDQKRGDSNLVFGLAVQDGGYLAALGEAESSLHMLRLLRPILLACMALICFFISYLSLRSRTAEYASMRSMGMRQSTMLLLVLLELAALELAGAALAVVVALCAGTPLTAASVLQAGGTLAASLAGGAAAAVCTVRINVMKLLRMEE